MVIPFLGLTAACSICLQDRNISSLSRLEFYEPPGNLFPYLNYFLINEPSDLFNF